jgi:sporulation protein YlmC with PRC-barrel domain
MVVKTGGWLDGRKVLISPAALGTPDWESRTFSVNLTKEQVRNSPNIDTKKPVYRQHEEELHMYYAWPTYWGNNFYAGGLYGIATIPPLLADEKPPEPETVPKKNTDDPHLRSTEKVTGYHIHTLDGDIGHVEDFILDDNTLDILGLMIDTSRWFAGKKALISPKCITSVSWDDSKVFVNITQETIRNSPEFDASQQLIPITGENVVPNTDHPKPRMTK